MNEAEEAMNALERALRAQLTRATLERDGLLHTLRLLVEMLDAATPPLDPAFLASCRRIVDSWEKAPRLTPEDQR